MVAPQNRRDEVWAQGAKPGDMPITSEVVPDNIEGLRKRQAMSKLEAYRKGDISDPKTDELFDALMDVMGIQDVDQELRNRGVRGLMESVINFATRRRG